MHNRKILTCSSSHKNKHETNYHQEPLQFVSGKRNTWNWEEVSVITFSQNTLWVGDVSQLCAEDLESGCGGGLERWDLGSHPYPSTRNILFYLPGLEYREESKVTTTICRLVTKVIVYWAGVVSEDKDLH